jgi:glycosyltransferase involved in cell wall biosynthesis
VRAKKILLLTSSLAQGGAEVVIRELALALCAAGLNVTLVSMTRPETFADTLEAAGVRVISLEMKTGGPNLRGVIRLLICVGQTRPDLIHAHMYHASVLARFVRLLFGIPAICTIHSEMEHSHSQRISVIENGVDFDRYRPNAERRRRTRSELGWQDSFVWLAVGRLERAKNYPSLISAFRDVLRQSPFSKLVIAGDGRLRAEIEELIERGNMQQSVSLLGARTDIPDLMNACDALVMCSAWEGGPLVLLEASASGRPVVSTAVGAAPQIVVPGRTGLLVPPGDTGALARGMSDLMALGKEKLDVMGQQGRCHIQDRFSLRRVHGQYMGLYEDVLAASR